MKLIGATAGQPKPDTALAKGYVPAGDVLIGLSYDKDIRQPLLEVLVGSAGRHRTSPV